VWARFIFDDFISDVPRILILFNYAMSNFL